MAARKFDGEKPRLALIPSELLEAVGNVLTFGAQKYDAHNWAQGMEWSRMFSALQRHLWAWNAGEDTDEETGFSHLWHAAACLTFLIAYEQRGTGTDDRYRVDDPD